MPGIDPESFTRLPEDYSEQILVEVLNFRKDCHTYQKPDDVNRLLALFQRVSIQDSYILDYLVVNKNSGNSWIRPYARKFDAAPKESLPSVIHLFDRDKIAGYRQPDELHTLEVDTLYRYLDYEKNPLGVFEYVFFVIELWATKAEWHAAEWLDSTPIFTKCRFDAFLEEAHQVEGLNRPDYYGPLAYKGDSGGAAKFLVHSPIGWDRIYFLECDILGDGQVEHSSGHVVADLGRGVIY